MTIDNASHCQHKITDAKSDMHSTPGQRSDDTLRRVAICVAGGLVAGCVVLAATNAGSEQHTWWGWLLIGAPLTWLGFLGLAALTSGALRAVVGAVRWSFSSRRRTGISAAAPRRKGLRARRFDMSISGLASAA
jgi:hypothetical protein